MSRKSELEEYFTPVQPRVESRFSENAMREIHEGRAQYAPAERAPRTRRQQPGYREVAPEPRYREAPQQPRYREVPPEPASAPSRRKKHRFLKFLFKLK